MSLMMSASGFPYIEGDFPSPIHFWEEERKQTESDGRSIGFLSCFFWRLPVLGMPLLVQPYSRNFLSRLCPVGSNRICIRPV